MEGIWERTDTLFRIANIIANSVIVMHFYMAYLKSRKSSAIIGAVFFVAMMAMFFVPFEMSSAFAYAMGILSIFTASVLIERANIPQKIFLAVTIYLLNWIAGGVVLIPWNIISRITFMNPQISLNPKLQYGAFVVASIFYFLLENAILLSEVRLVNRLYRNKREGMQWKELVLFISPSLAIMIGYWFASFLTDAYERDTSKYIWNNYSEYNYIEMFFQLFSFLAILTVIRAHQEIRKAQEETLQNALIAREIDDIKSHVGSIEKYYKDVRGMRHDMNNHVMVIRKLFEQGNKKEAEEYLETMESVYIPEEISIRTGNPVTDIIISDKKREAEELGIRYEADFEYPRKGKVETFDICILLSNALANAIEAARGEKDAYISVRGWTNRNAFLIDVKNSFYGTLVTDKESGLPVTGKRDKDSHGYGVINMKRVAEKYYGTIDIKQEGNEVEMTAMLMTAGDIT